MILRNYQQAMLDAAREHMKAGIRRVLLVAPTGAGKRIMAVYTIDRAQTRGKRCGFAMHRQELLKQAVKTLDEANIRHGIIKSGTKPDPEWLTQVASIQSLARR